MATDGAPDVVDHLYALRGKTLRCVDRYGHTWYEFRSPRWRLVDVSRGRIVDLLLAGIPDEVAVCLRPALTVRVVYRCVTRFHDPEFEGKLDCQPYLLGFDDGVVDLRDGRFRRGNPEDYVSLTVGYNYPGEATDATDVDALESLVPEPDLREYILTRLAHSLRGDRPRPFGGAPVDIWKTQGDDPRVTSLLDIIRRVLGDYCSEICLRLDQMIVQRGFWGGHTREMVDRSKRRLLLVQGIEQMERRGDPVMSVRDYRPQFEVLVVCPKVPSIPPRDLATWRRVRILDWDASAPAPAPAPPPAPAPVPPPAPTTPSAPAVMRLLLQRCSSPEPEIPVSLLDTTARFRKAGDFTGQFLTETLVRTQDPNDRIGLTELYSEFRPWCQDGLITVSRPNRRDFLDTVHALDFRVEGGDLRGVRLKYDIMKHAHKARVLLRCLVTLIGAYRRACERVYRPDGIGYREAETSFRETVALSE